jgi:hypothetical protein
MKFILDTNWIFLDPIDYEHKQYVLLAYLKKVADKLNDFELYPYFIEISLHLANTQTLLKENMFITTKKVFKSNDDELLLSELDFNSIPTQLTDEQLLEMQKVLNFAYPKFQDYFNIAKSVWTLVYESTHISIKKNKKNLFNINGYFYYLNDDDLYVWEYELSKGTKTNFETKSETREIFKGKLGERSISEILSEVIPRGTKTYPIFEAISNEKFPVQETLLPIFKRKIVSYILQSGVVETYKKFA